MHDFRTLISNQKVFKNFKTSALCIYVLRISVKIIQIRQFGVSYLFDLIHEIYFSVGFASIF